MNTYRVPQIHALAAVHEIDEVGVYESISCMGLPAAEVVRVDGFDSADGSQRTRYLTLEGKPSCSDADRLRHVVAVAVLLDSSASQLFAATSDRNMCTWQA